MTRAEVNALREKIRSFAKLEYGWDSYRAIPIAQASIDRACAFIEGLLINIPHVAAPGAFPAAQGGVMLEWLGAVPRGLTITFEPWSRTGWGSWDIACASDDPAFLNLISGCISTMHAIQSATQAKVSAPSE